ncbi:acetyltransferase [Halobacillus litoralis]|uniref:Acetyltransferase n=1 Tax=Halobacillus litoralis TaxID=45668 RepID=A0A845F7Y5_9BACI|nr:acetyltransferase [Halobacillus litoralis]
MDIFLIGDGGHSKVIQDIIHAEGKHKVIGVFDDKYKSEAIRKGVLSGPVHSVFERMQENAGFVLAIGNNRIRKNLVEQLQINTTRFISVIHPTAIVSPSATIGRGTVVMPKVVVNANAIVSDHCILNTGSTVEHNCFVNHFTHVSPSATLTGQVYLGEGVDIGAAATIIPGLKVGSWSIIGAGATVVEDIDANQTAVGCPAKVISKASVN